MTSQTQYVQPYKSGYYLSKTAHSIEGILKGLERLVHDESVGAVLKDGSTHGSLDDIKGAKKLQKAFEWFTNSKEGKGLKQYAGTNVKFDGFLYQNLGKNTIAAVRHSGPEKYLVINKSYSHILNDPIQALDVIAHEYLHAADLQKTGKTSEKSVNVQAARYFSKISQKSGSPLHYAAAQRALSRKQSNCKYH